MQKRSFSVMVACVTLIGCSNSSAPTSYGGGGGGTTGGGHTSSISVKNNSFSPTPDTVSAGTVTFTGSTPSNGHSVIWDSGPVGTLPPNTSVMPSGPESPTLVAGTYQYHCSIHGGPGTGMHGTIVVQ